MRNFRYALLIASMLIAMTATAVDARDPKSGGRLDARPSGAPGAVTAKAPQGTSALKVDPADAATRVNAPASTAAGVCNGAPLITYFGNFDFAWCNWTAANGYYVSNGWYYYLTWIEDAFTGTFCGWVYWYWNGSAWVGGDGFFASSGACGF